MEVPWLWNASFRESTTVITTNGKLLFLVEPGINSGNLAQFGPFAYRSNAASYLNLIWPLGLGLFIQLGRENLDYGKRRIGNGPELLLIPCIILAASGPIISSARGGALVMIGLLIVVAVSSDVHERPLKIPTLLRFDGTLCRPRHRLLFRLGKDRASIDKHLFGQHERSRTQIYETTLKMIDDYGKFGSGPGSFEAVAFSLSWAEYFTRWESWVHNDYLEFYLTFGKAGGSLMCCILFFLTVSATLILFFKPQKAVTWFGLMSLLGVGIHAAGDFPLQTLSILIPVCILSTLLTVSQKYDGNTASPLV